MGNDFMFFLHQNQGINYDNYGEDGRTRSPVPTNMMMTLGAATGDIRGSGNHLRVPGDAGAQPPGPFLNIHSRIRRHRSLPSPTFSNPKALPPPQQQRSSSFRLPVSPQPFLISKMIALNERLFYLKKSFFYE